MKIIFAKKNANSATRVLACTNTFMIWKVWYFSPPSISFSNKKCCEWILLMAPKIDVLLLNRPHMMMVLIIAATILHIMSSLLRFSLMRLKCKALNQSVFYGRWISLNGMQSSVLRKTFSSPIHSCSSMLSVENRYFNAELTIMDSNKISHSRNATKMS